VLVGNIPTEMEWSGNALYFGASYTISHSFIRCCGADWFQLPQQGGWEGVHITIKELLPIVGAIWGRVADPMPL